MAPEVPLYGATTWMPASIFGGVVLRPERAYSSSDWGGRGNQGGNQISADVAGPSCDLKRRRGAPLRHRGGLRRATGRPGPFRSPIPGADHGYPGSGWAP